MIHERISHTIDTEKLRQEAEAKYGERIKEILQGIYKDSDLTPEERERIANVVPRLVVEKSDALPRLDDIKPEEFGVVTFSPEINGDLDYEQREVFIPSEQDLEEFNYFPFFTALEEIAKRYSKDYDFASFPFMLWLCDRPEQVPESMRQGDFCKFIGSRFRSIEGEWWYFDAQWNGKELEQWHADGLYHKWGPADKIVLLKKKVIQ